MAYDFFSVGVLLGQMCHSFWRVCSLYLVLLDVYIAVINVCLRHPPMFIVGMGDAEHLGTAVSNMPIIPPPKIDEYD
jgi:hypothetical protein